MMIVAEVPVGEQSEHASEDNEEFEDAGGKERQERACFRGSGFGCQVVAALRGLTAADCLAGEGDQAASEAAVVEAAAVEAKRRWCRADSDRGFDGGAGEAEEDGRNGAWNGGGLDGPVDGGRVRGPTRWTHARPLLDLGQAEKEMRSARDGRSARGGAGMGRRATLADVPGLGASTRHTRGSGGQQALTVEPALSLLAPWAGSRTGTPLRCEAYEAHGERSPGLHLTAIGFPRRETGND
ncbi:hypothetical protein S7711_11251 [Stachybotrys chartarum IBT 7711]|uniref:Uncharacterized protein n=1 Tax=Stachybotrys chartarum (strain CBS 109288 / IBT 7711) TaxID=1280523 RepID=A0A084ARU5_STACB|nr:hypothetical protein S7711_11251 [Stachybotrys chartarum IBT 7711]KFA54100.1 hypothetical protein S40293_10947 [Stachybotrys chartarum IBT 40293]KFA76183.1 hypothetical protein S40288_10877 [Stachybotrys chartarum IBT 40288]